VDGSEDGDVLGDASMPMCGDGRNAYTGAVRASYGDVLASSGDADQSNAEEGTSEGAISENGCA